MRKSQSLLIDADDTLWENNIYFEEVIDAYCGLLELRGFDRKTARRTLSAIEHVSTKTSGYGIRNFHTSLCEACVKLLGSSGATSELDELSTLCDRLERRAIHLLPGVADTLRDLSGRHRIILFTKGDLDDQIDKVQRSGLRRYVHQVDVVREKDADTYRDAVGRHGLKPVSTWMIGNSPRSDILPALEAGLGAVFIPHRITWELERGELPSTGAARLLVLEEFEQLAFHF